MPTKAKVTKTSESYHIRLDNALVKRIAARATEENRNFNNTCETLLYEAINKWEEANQR